MRANKSKISTKSKDGMKVSVDELQKASREFRVASQETDSIMTRLEKVVKDLEATWDDAGQQVFSQYYREWLTQTVGISQLLKLTATELDAIADRYYAADGDHAEKAKGH